MQKLSGIYGGKHMLKNAVQIIVAVCLVALAASYATAQDVPLRVGITPDSPPLIFKLNGKITGVEADLARRLGKELNRPVELVELRWDRQIAALLEGKIDIIMSGMTITDARKVRINFTDPYLKSGLVAAIRAEDSAKYNSAKSILSGYQAVGVIKGTTGEAFVQKNMSNSTSIATLSKVRDAASELQTRRIDVFIHDAPAVIWLVSENEADLRGVWELMTEENLGWGIRKGEGDFLKQMNAILRRWKQDGTLDQTLRNWLPAKYFERVK